MMVQVLFSIFFSKKTRTLMPTSFGDIISINDFDLEHILLDEKISENILIYTAAH